MQRSDLTTTVLAAAAFAAAIMLSPSGARADLGELASGLYIGAGIGQAQHDDACGIPGRVLWTVG